MDVFWNIVAWGAGLLWAGYFIVIAALFAIAGYEWARPRVIRALRRAP